jgi:hypothetical protein
MSPKTEREAAAWVLDTLFPDGLKLSTPGDYQKLASLMVDVNRIVLTVEQWDGPERYNAAERAKVLAEDVQALHEIKGLPPEDVTLKDHFEEVAEHREKEAIYKASLEQSNERANPAPQFLQRRAEDRNPRLGVGDRRDAIDGRNASKIPMSPEVLDKLLRGSG